METPKSHPHAELIKAWADGAKIQSRHLIDFDNVEQWSKWTDDDEPDWCDEDYQFRIKPQKKKTNNKTWKPKLNEMFFELQLDSDGSVSVQACSIIGEPEDVLTLNSENKTCFPYTKEGKHQAKKMARRIDSVLKGEKDFIESSQKPSIDEQILTDGEIALIRALRKVEILNVYDWGKTTLCSVGSDCVYSEDTHIAFSLAYEAEPNENREIVSCLKQIQEEQERLINEPK